MEQRLHGEVRPFPFITILGRGTVLTFLDIEAVLLQLLQIDFPFLLRQSGFLVGDTLLVVYRSTPKRFLLPALLCQLLYEHGHFRI